MQIKLLLLFRYLSLSRILGRIAFLIMNQQEARGEPNPNYLAEFEHIRGQIVPFLINRIGIRPIQIQ